MDYAESCDLRSIMRNCNIAEYQKPCICKALSQNLQVPISCSVMSWFLLGLLIFQNICSQALHICWFSVYSVDRVSIRMSIKSIDWHFWLRKPLHCGTLDPKWLLNLTWHSKNSLPNIRWALIWLFLEFELYAEGTTFTSMTHASVNIYMYLYGEEQKPMNHLQHYIKICQITMVFHL